MRPIPVPKSTRCKLSHVRECDFDDLHLIMKDRDVKKFLPEFCEITESKSDFLSVMNSFDVLWDKGISVLWGIYLNDYLVGFIGLLDIPTNATIFYSIEKESRNRGLAKEAVEAVLTFVSDSELTTEMYSEVFINNIASIKVLMDNGFIEYSKSNDKVFFKKELK